MDKWIIYRFPLSCGFGEMTCRIKKKLSTYPTKAILVGFWSPIIDIVIPSILLIFRLLIVFYQLYFNILCFGVPTIITWDLNPIFHNCIFKDYDYLSIKSFTVSYLYFLIHMFLYLLISPTFHVWKVSVISISNWFWSRKHKLWPWIQPEEGFPQFSY